MNTALEHDTIDGKETPFEALKKERGIALSLTRRAHLKGAMESNLVKAPAENRALETAMRKGLGAPLGVKRKYQT